MNLRALILACLLSPALASAGTLRLAVTAPSFNASNDSCSWQYVESEGGVVQVPGTPLSDLRDILVMGRRFAGPFDSLMKTVDAVGKEGQAIPFDLIVPDGSMGSLWTLARDWNGNTSCRGAEYVWVMPLPAAPPPAPPIDSTSGLSAQYYSYDRWHDFKALLATRIDSMVAFNWGAGGPGFFTTSTDYWSVIWTGFITFPEDGTKTLIVDRRHGVRLWVGSMQIIDSWMDADGEVAGSVYAAAGVYPIRIEYYHSYGNARCLLYWQYGTTPKEIIPRAALRP